MTNTFKKATAASVGIMSALAFTNIPSPTQAAMTSCYSFSKYSVNCYSSGYSYPSYQPTYYSTPSYNYSSQLYSTILKAKLLEIQLKYDMAKLDRERQLEAERQAQKAIQDRLDKAKQTFTAVYQDIFSKEPTSEDQEYWVDRILDDKLNDAALREKMRYYKSLGKTRGESATPKVAGATNNSLVTKVNAIFRSVYNRNPSPSENTYWASRIADKPTEQALKDAMAFHKAQSISH